MKAPGEEQPRLEDSIELNRSMTPQEAINLLATFHNTSNEAVLAAFRNLRGFEQGTVVFTDSSNNGTPCISMEGKHPDGNFAWHYYINRSTGQPMMKVA